MRLQSLSTVDGHIFGKGLRVQIYFKCEAMGNVTDVNQVQSFPQLFNWLDPLLTKKTCFQKNKDLA
jgi:hypothetical protein